MSATSIVWLIDENGNRIPGTDKLLTFDLAPDWRLETNGYWTLPRDATVAGFEVIQVPSNDGSPTSVIPDDSLRPFKKRETLDAHLWLPIGPRREHADERVAYLRDEITLDEFEQRIDQREQATSAGIPSDANR